MPDSLGACELTWQERAAIDVGEARREHEGYRRALREAGLEVIAIDADEAFPDCPFVEDLLVDAGTGPRVLCRPGAASRRGEAAGVEAALAARDGDGVPLARMPDSMTLDGGDVLRFRDVLYVGRSTRTDEAARRWLAEVTGLPVVGVGLHGVLHLKTGVVALDDDTLLAAPGAVDLDAFGAPRVVLHPACNARRLPDRVLVEPAALAAVRDAGFDAVPVPIGEFSKAEAGLTCLSVLLHPRP